MMNLNSVIKKTISSVRIFISGSDLRIKLFIAYFLPSAIILVITGGLTFAVIDHGIKKSLRHEMENLTDSVKLMIENSLDLSIRNHLRGVAGSDRDIVAAFYDKFRKGMISESEAKKMAGEVLLSQRIGKTGYIFVWDISGAPDTVILAVHPFIQGNNVAGVDFVQKGVKLKSGYIQYKWKNPGDDYEREKVMYLSYFAQWKWVIAASSYREEFIDLISITDFSAKIRNIKFGENGYYYIIDSRGNIIIHPSMTGNVFNTTDREGKYFIREICERKNGETVYYWPEPGESGPSRKISIYRYIPDFDWIVISSSYPNEYNTTLRSVGLIILSSIIMLILIIAVVTYLSGSRILKPLKVLMEKFRIGAEGDFSINIPVTSADEFAELAGHFNTFIEQIRTGRESLISAENYLRNIIDSLPSILAAVDSGERVKLWNRGAELFTGIKSDKAEAERIYTLFPFLENFRGSIDSAIALKTSAEFRESAFSSTGDRRELRISVYPFSQEDLKIAVIRMDDITDEIRKDEQLLQAQKMEIVGNLAGGLAHDFNNVLAGIIGTVSLIKHQMETGKSDGSSGKYIRIIESSARRAADIVDQLLAISRKNEPSLSPLDLNKSLENVVMICRNSLDKSIEIESLYLDTPAVIEGAAAQIEQILLNIFVNAAHAMTIMRPEWETYGGRITASVSRIKAGPDFCSSRHEAVEGLEYITVTITDTGVGISSGLQKKIFDPFFTTKSKEKGTGLGLSMVYNIIRAHRGFIELYSEPGSGTSFRIFIPASERNPAELSDESSDIESLKGNGNILIIDDEETVRETARGILEECGYTVNTANGGMEGINFFRVNSSSTDLIILDMSMPGMSGRDTFIELKKINRDTPVLLASGFKYDQMVQETIRLGVEDFIQKPYSLRELAGKVLKIIRRP